MSKAEDILEIQMLAQRYADAVMRHDADDWGACWAEDGVWDLGQGEPFRGRDNVVSMWKKAMEGYPFAVFIVLPGIVDVDGETATMTSYVEENLEGTDGNGFRVYGCYKDNLVKENGKWVFKERHYNVLYRGPVSFDGNKTGWRG